MGCGWAVQFPSILPYPHTHPSVPDFFLKIKVHHSGEAGLNISNSPDFGVNTLIKRWRSLDWIPFLLKTRISKYCTITGLYEKYASLG
jgi:hypothetical protein